MQITCSIVVAGKVQGVYFRQSAREKAQESGITGFVKNQADGTVYIMATGTEERLESLLRWCRQGPPAAVVEAVTVERLPPQVFTSFIIR